MNNLTIAQKIYLAAWLAVAVTWLALQIGVPIYEYNYGKSALTALLAHLSSIMLFETLGIAVIGWILQGMGILPTVQREIPSTPPRLGVGPIGGLRNLAIWIVFAAVLVIFFNLFPDGSSERVNSVSAPERAPDLMGIFINWFPMLMIFGVWVFFLRQMRAQQGKDVDKPKD